MKKKTLQLVVAPSRRDTIMNSSLLRLRFAQSSDDFPSKPAESSGSGTLLDIFEFCLGTSHFFGGGLDIDGFFWKKNNVVSVCKT